MSGTEPPAEAPNATRFQGPGTLSRPGPLGRVVRLLLGAWLLYATWTYLRYPGVFVRDTLPHWTTLIGIVVALWVVPPVVNIGFGLDWRLWPRRIPLGVLVAWGLLNLATTGGLWGRGLGWFTWLFGVYTLGHLGLSFALAAAIATPGCEMRAIPHLWTLVTGRATREHACPGFIQGLDDWEARRNAS